MTCSPAPPPPPRWRGPGRRSRGWRCPAGRSPGCGCAGRAGCGRWRWGGTQVGDGLQHAPPALIGDGPGPAVEDVRDGGHGDPGGASDVVTRGRPRRQCSRPLWRPLYSCRFWPTRRAHDREAGAPMIAQASAPATNGHASAAQPGQAPPPTARGGRRAQGARRDHRRRELRQLPRPGRHLLPRRRPGRAHPRPDAHRPRRLPRGRRRVLRRLRRRRAQGGPRPRRGHLGRPEQHDQVRRRARHRRRRRARADQRRPRPLRPHPHRQSGAPPRGRGPDPRDTGTDVVVNYLPVGSERPPAGTWSRPSRPASGWSTASPSSSPARRSGASASRPSACPSSATTSRARWAPPSCTASWPACSATAASSWTAPASSTSAGTWTSTTCSSALAWRARRN